MQSVHKMGCNVICSQDVCDVICSDVNVILHDLFTRGAKSSPKSLTQDLTSFPSSPGKRVRSVY